MFDSHCHLDFPDFDPDRDQILARCRQQGMQGILIPGVTAATWSRLLALTDAEPDLYPALGLHPMFIDQHCDEDLDQLEQLLKENRAIAIGEIGLDFYLPELDRDMQLHFFVEQLKLAKRYQLPVVLHVRKAHDQVLSQLRRLQLVGGTVHSFSGSEQQAYQYIDLGFKLGFGGAMTYPRAKKLQRLAASLPLDSIVLETDAPDMVPAMSTDHQRNTPLQIWPIAKFLTDLRQEDEQSVYAQTTLTIRKLLNI